MAHVQQTQSFYSLTLEAPSAPIAAVTCNAIPGLKSQDQQIFEARGQRLYLHRITENEDRTEVKVSTVLEQNVFGVIRGVTAFRIPGTATDQLVVASDSGRMAMFNYDADHNTLKQVHLETFGKSGIRRTVPGQYLVSDPRGRCLLLASTEKNKVVYMVNRQPDSSVRISSPHEANQWASLCFGVCALDTGWEHPVFAALEVDYAEADADSSGAEYERREKHLVYYTVDLGLNHVVKSWSDIVDYSANKVFAVPGGQDGPSGVVVCAEGRIYYCHDKSAPLSIPIPRRSGPTEDPQRTRIIVSGCLHLSKARHEFFFLLQTEDGDVFKLTLDIEEDAQGRKTSPPSGMNLKYYETFPVGKALLLIRKGYIFVAAEHGDSKLYHVNDLAEDLEFEPWNNFSSDSVSADPADPYTPTYFTPRGLVFTSLAVSRPSLHPLMKTKVENLTGEDAPQIYALQGTGNRSLFKTIRHGLEVSEIVSSPLGNIPFDNLWSLKHRASDEFHAYLLLSSTYGDKTIVLSIGDEVETMEESPFMTNRATVSAQTMGDATLVQVHARGVLSILESGALNEWPAPAHRTIVAASANKRQLLLGLSSSELAFFYMSEDGVLQQLEEMPEMSGKITAVGVAATPRGQKQAKFGVVGCDDCTIRVLSIDTDTPLEAKSVQALSDVPTSIEVVQMRDPQANTTIDYVHIGLASGLYLRATIDEVTGELGEVRTKFLGARPIRLFPVQVQSEQAVLACSSRSWLGYNHPQTSLYTLTPLVADQLEAARPFVSEHLRGMCAVQGQNLLIFSVEGVEGRLSSKAVPLQYTPRAMSRNPWYPLWYVVESEGNTLSRATKRQLIAAAKTKAEGQNGMKVETGEKNGVKTEAEDDAEAEELERHLGLSRAPGHWASCIQVIDPLATAAVSTIELTENEAALCTTVVAFESKEWEVYLAVGTGQHLKPGEPVTGDAPKGFVHIYRLSEEGRRMELTPFPTPIYALHPFVGRLAIGVGNELFIYDLGIKSLLRKTRGTVVPNLLTNITSQGHRLVCADVSESLTYVVYKPAPINRLLPFADDTVNRWTTALALLDYETCAAADKFGNLFVLRCPPQASSEADAPGLLPATAAAASSSSTSNRAGYLGGTAHRLDLRAHLATPDIATSLTRASLQPGGGDSLIVSSLHGTLSLLVPLPSRSDAEFFSQLESLLRLENPGVAGREHLGFRSAYVPVKGVVDGDLCEWFMGLKYDAKAKVAGELERESREVGRKISEARGRVAF